MKKKIKVFILSYIFYGIIGTYLVTLLYRIFFSLQNGESIKFSAEFINVFLFINDHIENSFFQQILFIANIVLILISTYLAFIYEPQGKITQTGLMKVTDTIFIPIPAGTGQYGSSHFMTFEELDRTKEIKCYNTKTEEKPKKGGVVIGIRAMGRLPDKKSQKILYIGEDRHVLMVGATRSGKSRRIILESIWLTILSGENMVVTDPKGELWAYTNLFAEKNGYNTVTIDFRNPNKGCHFNYMQEIIDALKENDAAEAIDLTWDLVSVLVGEAKGEPIWHNGECAAIAACILIVAMEAPEEYRNLTNVYYFLFNMATPDEYGEMPISRYLDSLEENHPARAVFAMASIAHAKTRGSFFSSALGTLRHFTNPKIAEMTSCTDYSFEKMANHKTIIYIILPDEKTTLYGLGSMYIMQHYIYNVKSANMNGGRCPIDWWYFLDEFGNLPYIPPIPQFLAVGAGRGMRFLLALQDFQQLQKKYRDDFSTIKNNCDAWIYLKCSNEDTEKEFSSRCGNYTIQLNSTSFSEKKNSTGGNYSASLTGRALLQPEEVGMIEAPFCLICFAGKPPLMLISPDLSYYPANIDYGLGDEKYNRQVIIKRNSARKEREVKIINLWGIWNEFKEVDGNEFSDEPSDDERISFLD